MTTQRIDMFECRRRDRRKAERARTCRAAARRRLTRARTRSLSAVAQLRDSARTRGDLLLQENSSFKLQWRFAERDEISHDPAGDQDESPAAPPITQPTAKFHVMILQRRSCYTARRALPALPPAGVPRTRCPDPALRCKPKSSHRAAR